MFHRKLNLKLCLVSAKKFGVTEVSMETVTLISHATQSRLRSMLEKVSAVAQHRTDSCKVRTNAWSTHPSLLNFKEKSQTDCCSRTFWLYIFHAEHATGQRKVDLDPHLGFDNGRFTRMDILVTQFRIFCFGANFFHFTFDNSFFVIVRKVWRPIFYTVTGYICVYVYLLIYSIYCDVKHLYKNWILLIHQATVHSTLKWKFSLRLLILKLF